MSLKWPLYWRSMAPFFLADTLRQLQAEAREYIGQFHTLADWCADWPAALRQRLNQRQPALKPVFNLTGTVLHTSFGPCTAGRICYRGGD